MLRPLLSDESGTRGQATCSIASASDEEHQCRSRTTDTGSCHDLSVEPIVDPRSAAEFEGARLRTNRREHVAALTVGPSFQNWGFEVEVPAGTVVVARAPVPGATAFSCVPEDEQVRQALIPEQVSLENPGWHGHYDLVFSYADVPRLLDFLPTAE